MKLDDLRTELETATHVTPDMLRRVAEAVSNVSGGGRIKATDDRCAAADKRLDALEKRLSDCVHVSDFLAALDRIKAIEAGLAAQPTSSSE